jgi:hypothetical protein
MDVRAKTKAYFMIFLNMFSRLSTGKKTSELILRNALGANTDFKITHYNSLVAYATILIMCVMT